MHVGSVGVVQEPGARPDAAGVGVAEGTGAGVGVAEGAGAAVGVAEATGAGPPGTTLGVAVGATASEGGRLPVRIDDRLEGHERHHYHDHSGQRRRPQPDPHERPPHGAPHGSRDGEHRSEAPLTLLGTPRRQFAPVAQLELREHVRDVVLHRVRAEPEPSADLGVRPALAQRVQHAPLGGGQHIGMARPAATVAIHGTMLEQRRRRLPHPILIEAASKVSPSSVAHPRRDGRDRRDRPLAGTQRVTHAVRVDTAPAEP